MVAIEQHLVVVQFVLRAVGEGVRALFGIEDCKDLVVSDAAKRDNSYQFWKAINLCGEEWSACFDFVGRWFIRRWHASDRVGDHAVFEREPVVRRRFVSSSRKPKLFQCCVQEVAGVIAGEGPPRAVCAADARREPDDEQARIAIAKRGDSAVKPRGLSGLILGSIVDEARAQGACLAGLGNNLVFSRHVTSPSLKFVDVFFEPSGLNFFGTRACASWSAAC